MRVLTFIHSFEPGGVERIALRLVRHWRAQGVDAPLFMGRADGVMADDVGHGLDPIVPRSWIATARWETLWMILTLPRAVRRVRPDILFCTGNTYAVVAVALKLLLGRACPPIVAKISNDLDRRDAPWVARTAYRVWLHVQGRFIDRFVGMDTPMLDEIVGGLGVAFDRVTIIPDPALSDAMIARLRQATAPPRYSHGRRFVAIGRLVRQKNVAMMLRAFAVGSTIDDRLTIIGDGPDRQMLEALAIESGIAGRVAFRGYVADPTALLVDADVLLLSSDYEGVPAVVLEALAAGIAIVATDCSRSMAALLDDGALGTLVPVRDEAGFAAAIAAVRPGNADMVRSLAKVRRFTIERAAFTYLSIFADTVCAESAKRKASVEAGAGDVWRRHNGHST